MVLLSLVLQKLSKKSKRKEYVRLTHLCLHQWQHWQLKELLDEGEPYK